MFVEPRCGFVCLISKGVGLFVGTCLNVNLFVCGDREQVCLFVCEIGVVFEPVRVFVCLRGQGTSLFVCEIGVVFEPVREFVCLFEPGCGNFVCCARVWKVDCKPA